jgi:uncharacterized membrane protein YgcG
MWAAAAWVGLALLYGAISYVGGRLMQSALGGAVLGDVKTWIEEAVAELEAFVSAELRKQLTDMVVNQMQADLEGIVQNITEYASLKPQNQLANKFLLEYCDTKTAELVPLSLDYDQAISVTTAAMAYRLFALYGLYELDHDQGHISSAKLMMNDFVTKTLAIRDRIAAAMAPETRLVIRIDPGFSGGGGGGGGGGDEGGEGGGGGGPGAPIWYGNILLDGKPVWRPQTEYTSEQDAMNAAKAVWTNLAVPVRQQQQDFLSQVNSAVKYAAICYNDMCKKIGSGYPIPPSVAAAPELPIPKTLIMHGAVIIGPTE